MIVTGAGGQDGSYLTERLLQEGAAVHALVRTTGAAGASVVQSVCEGAVIGAGAAVGPFAHLTPGTTLEPGARAGARGQ